MITAADGEEMNGIEDLAGYLSDNKAPGDTVELTVVRDGEDNRHGDTRRVARLITAER